MKETITCPSCNTAFEFNSFSKEVSARYCPICRSALNPEKATTIPFSQKESSHFPSSTSVSFLTEHIPAEEQIQFAIGPYQVLHSIGKGGMGEVFLAYDTTCGRRLALKKIRPDLATHKQLHNRFLKEARITCQLIHPAIIPIYTVYHEGDLTYYTMPYVEGETLKQLLKRASIQEKKGQKLDHTASSIPALIRIFLSICQAIAYAHSKHVLHRDLKPENIIIGQYGQIVILDWGLAKLLKASSEAASDESLGDQEENVHPHHHLTHIGKVVGTIAYMAPERVLGHPANFQTDIYSLGVILYQLLTLRQPFHRPSLKAFRENIEKEKLADPVEIAPYRDVPKSLSKVVLKCLSPKPEMRYKTVDELIRDLENYIEGRSEWFQMCELDIHNKGDWEFQENVLIAEHVALTRGIGASDWVSLMVSKASFQENIKLEAKVKIGENGHGIGFLLSIPEADERRHLNDGYCLWIGSESNKSTKLLRSSVEVMHAPDVFLKQHEWTQIRIEKIDTNIHFYLNDLLQFSYISHLPLAGTHLGLLSRDADFAIKDFQAYVGSQNATVNCLAVPDAFLAHHDYPMALSEYRRIGYSFPGRAEGREAMFRAGITLLEQANNEKDLEKKSALYDLAHEEFHKLHGTPGAPLEYLGKALIYQALGDYEEEAKCFELAYRRYPRHPLLPVLQEQIVYRMHESSRYNRQATFNFILLALRYLPDVVANAHTQKLLNSLEKHWELLPFILPHSETSEELKYNALVIILAFWLVRPYVIGEMIDILLDRQSIPSAIIGNALFSLIELGSWELAKAKLDELLRLPNVEDFFPIEKSLNVALAAHSLSLETAIDMSPQSDARTLLYLMHLALDQQKPELVERLYPLMSPSIEADACLIWAALLQKNWKKAGELLHRHPLEQLRQEASTMLHFLYGCWLYVTEGKEIAAIHFSGVFEVPYPRSWTLFSYYFKGQIAENEGWMAKSFLWERRQLYRQLSLFYHCIGENEKSRYYRQLAQREVFKPNLRPKSRMNIAELVK